MNKPPAPSQNPSPNPSQPFTSLIGVHVVAEFVFCPRAAVNAWENVPADEGAETWRRTPRIDFLPDFDARKIEETIAARFSSLRRLLTWSGTVLAILVVLSRLFTSRLPTAAGFTLLAFTVVRCLGLIRDIAVLALRLRAMKQSPVCEPDPKLPKMQAANWWSLLKAGFCSYEYDAPFCHQSLGLAGAPWRVLHRGSLRIPVFRKIRGEAKLGHQHFLRMAAYCRLVTESEGGEAPYSVVLFGRGYDGVTVPNLDRYQKELPRTVEDLRAMLQLVASRRMVPDVPVGNPCRGCHWGRPEKSSHGTIANVRRIKWTRGKNGRLYRSDCGDRFDWVPGHELADRLGLRAGE